MKNLEGRVAMVTGAANGVGAGIAAVLAREGAAVGIVDLDAAAGAQTAEALRREGLKATAFPGDVVDRSAMDASARSIKERYGRLDILAANAGIYPLCELESMRDHDWDKVMDINVKGAVHAIQACAPAMRAQRYGRVVLTSSITGPVTGQRGFSHYAASKAAMLGLMRSAALEFADDGITVNAVQPGNVRTPGVLAMGQQFIVAMAKSIPMKRLAEPTDVGWAVRFLVSEEAGYITGQTIVVDGGQTLPELGVDLAI
jgi:3-oxoacyl-[acyl-carrier protein] reductase